MSYRLGIDIGGTFTDFTIFDEVTGETALVHKIPSVPENPLEGIVTGLKHIKESLAGAEVGYVLHGTTIGVNTLLEGKGTSTVLITTKGFRDVYDIGRQWRGHEVYNLFVDRPKMLLPRRNIFDVEERLNYRGEVLQPLDVDSARQTIRAMADRNVESVAICLLFSFANPAHERALDELVREIYPNAFVSISSEVNPEYREYERTCTTVANSYIGPKVGEYAQEMQEKVRSVLPDSQVLIMQSNGGVGTPGMLAKLPVQTIMSGPVAGVIGARYLGELTGLRNLISIDIGGTSCDMSVIPGRLLTISEMSIGRHPIRVPQVDISIIGSGGGSIAKLGMGNVLKVGPESAGAHPGPACYGRGGAEPTLTDALVVLGHLNPKYLLAQKMPVFSELAEKVLKERIADPWNMTVLEAAGGVVRVLTAQVAASMRTITVERGYDPRDFTLVAFGGAGPSVACDLADELRIPKILVPLHPGNFCAFGMQTTDLMRERGITRIGLADEYPVELINELLDKIEATVLGELSTEGIERTTTRIERFLELRYSGHSYEVQVPIDRLASKADLQRVVQRFHELHGQTFGHKAEGEPVEIVNLKVRAIGVIPKPSLRRFALQSERAAEAALVGRRHGYFRSTEPVTVDVYNRDGLAAGNVISGPAVIEELTSTTVVHPNHVARVDELLNLVIEAC